MAADADTRLIPSFHIGKRDAGAAMEFIGDLALRIGNRGSNEGAAFLKGKR